MSKDSEQKLKLAECALTQGVQVQNLTEIQLKNINHLKDMLDMA
jgi:hypothetical protein